jgi:hypothetical protein
MAGKSSKGACFERAVCKRLSLWWTDGERDDIYWRTCQSGGRATSRRQKGIATPGQYGDVVCVDPNREGHELTDLFSIELKKGYGRWSILDLICGKPAVKYPFKLFWKQASEDACACEVGKEPLLIVQRHACRPMVFLTRLYFNLITSRRFPREGKIAFSVPSIQNAKGLHQMIGLTLDDFFYTVPKENVKRMRNDDR